MLRHSLHFQSLLCKLQRFQQPSQKLQMSREIPWHLSWATGKFVLAQLALLFLAICMLQELINSSSVWYVTSESLLAYSYDDGSGSEAGDEETHEAAAETGVDAPASEDGDSSMDAEVCLQFF